MRCRACEKSVEIHDGAFEKNGMWPGSSVKRYDFKCKDCIGKVAIDGGPPQGAMEGAPGREYQDDEPLF